MRTGTFHISASINPVDASSASFLWTCFGGLQDNLCIFIFDFLVLLLIRLFHCTTSRPRIGVRLFACITTYPSAKGTDPFRRFRLLLRLRSRSCVPAWRWSFLSNRQPTIGTARVPGIPSEVAFAVLWAAPYLVLIRMFCVPTSCWRYA